MNTVDLLGANPVSLQGFTELELQLIRFRAENNVFFSPSYSPSITWTKPFIFTIHDLIHVDIPQERSLFKTLYYNTVVKAGVHRASRILTVSEYSRNRILEWSGVSESKVVVVGNGVGKNFSPDGDQFDPGYPYIFYVGNSKPHKNTLGLIRALALMPDPNIRLLLSGKPDINLQHEALKLGIYERVKFAGHIPEDALPSYYRGAAVVTMPSLYEGFGLPPLEGMASGVPVVVSETTSLPEVVGNAGILIDPLSPGSIAEGLYRALTDTDLRSVMIQRGLNRAQQFNWGIVADRVKKELNQVQ